MGLKLFVGNLSFDMSEEDLKDLFSQAGSVQSATIIKDRMSGRSKGFAFVEMSSDEEAQTAVDQFNGKEVGGRAIVVNEARPMEKRPDRGGFSGNRGGDRGGFSKNRF